MKRALVTGATGFIGAMLVRALQREGWVVQAVGRADAGIETFAYDALDTPRGRLREIIARSGCGTVFHLAGTTDDSAGSMEQVNVGYAEALLDAVASAERRPGVVLVGTAAEYGEVPTALLPVREDHPCRPTTRYGATKLRQTELGLAAAAAGLTVHLPRLFNVIGPGMRGHLALGRLARDIAALGAAGGRITSGTLQARRDFIAAEDAAHAMIILSEIPDANGVVVNFSSGVSLGMAQAVDALIAAAEVSVVVAVDSAFSGVSAVQDMRGCTKRRTALGLRIRVPDLTVEMARLLKSCQSAMPATAACTP